MPKRLEYVKSELIFPLYDKPTPECHASTIAATEDYLVAAWFGGAKEKSPDVGIWVSRYKHNVWTKPVEVANGAQLNGKRLPCWNPVLFQPEEGPLMLFYKVGPNPREWWGMLMTSDDQGESWSTPRRLPEGIYGPIKNKPIQLDNGILCPSSTEHNGWRVHFELTYNLGKTWRRIVPISNGKHFSAIQPSILMHRDGRLQVLCRSRQGVIVQSWSVDKGKTWGELTATPLPNPNSGIDTVTLKDGRH
ncbi:MAG: exo-alpha-sialidase [Candidatus Tectomicrobia bacterium]|uniref:Exo-alpha-sialidase n=1 Tax=Tectimicrobiota bacterium TaxID=2528274 RepID=A0A932CP26_UNCTE|nr:exo-alpha-sialidase [Candidatus Tectomicrobia bacterium]